MHEPNVTDGTKPYKHILNHCTFIDTTLSDTPYWNNCVAIDNTRDRGFINTIIFNNCNFGNGKVLINGNYDIDVRIQGSNNAYICRNDKLSNYPTTDYTNFKEYIGTEPLVGGEVLKYSNGINIVEKADSNTPFNLIAGICLTPTTEKGVIKILSKTYINKSGTFGQELYVDSNGNLTTAGTIPIGVCLGECSLLY